MLFLKKLEKLIFLSTMQEQIVQHILLKLKKDMDYMIDLNLKIAFHVAQLSIKKMLIDKNRKSIGGSIINMSSQLGKVGAPNRSIYNMSKFGIEGLTKGMALDLATKNIRVNSVCPTFVETPMVKKVFKDKKFKDMVFEKYTSWSIS